MDVSVAELKESVLRLEIKTTTTVVIIACKTGLKAEEELSGLGLVSRLDKRRVDVESNSKKSRQDFILKVNSMLKRLLLAL